MNTKVPSGDRASIPFWACLTTRHAFDWTKASVVGNGSSKKN